MTGVMNSRVTGAAPYRRMDLAKALLADPRADEPAWPVVMSALFFMICALGLAVAIITTPPASLTPPGFTPVTPDPTPAVEEAVPTLR
jgi:hypothetical protein